jgi:integrase
MGGWRPRKGRVQEGYYNERTAHVRAAELVTKFVSGEEAQEQAAVEKQTKGPTFREVAHAYLDWLEHVRGAKPSRLRQHRSDLAEPGTAQVDAVLNAVAATGVSPRTVNRHREVITAIFNVGMRSSRFNLPANPSARSDRRRVQAPGALIHYTPEEVEALAEALAKGKHRDRRAYHPQRLQYQVAEDWQDAEAAPVVAYCGLRLGELLALRWRNADWAGSALTIERALSAGIEGTTKSGTVRRVPLAAQAPAALDRLSRREHYISPDDFVFCNTLDGSALRRRYERARDAAQLRPLRWHDLRHTFGSVLVAGGVDLMTVKDAMGHAQLTTTSRYLHARPAHENAAKFTSAFSPPRTATH